MQKTGIEYLTHTWNPIAMRCTKCSSGCDGCWHLRTADRLCNNMALPEDERLALAGTGPFVLRERELSSPSRTKKQAVIGVQFMGDLFHEAVPDNFQYEVYRAMILNKQNTYLILTKRPQIMADLFSPKNCFMLPPLEGIWHGLTVCNQQEADEKIPIFLRVPGKKFLSIEPMLGPIKIDNIDCEKNGRGWFWVNALTGKHDDIGYPCADVPHLDAVILGGETGHSSRWLHPDWVRSVRDQCATAGVPFFFKQWGEWMGKVDKETYDSNDGIYQDGYRFQRIGKKKSGRELDGRTHDDLPWINGNQEKYAVDCCNGECGWTGYSTECVCFKHDREKLFCPECHEVVEPVVA
jgi:protein gp37